MPPDKSVVPLKTPKNPAAPTVVEAVENSPEKRIRMRLEDDVGVIVAVIFDGTKVVEVVDVDPVAANVTGACRIWSCP